MDRRDFLQMAALGGLAVLSPVGTRRARASEPYKGPFFVTVHAGGGWDPTYLCDPKGGRPNDGEAVNRLYTPDQIGKAGDIRYAPVALTADMGGGQTYEIYSVKRFFETWGPKLTVINGIDTSTNNHETGTRVVWSGRSAEGYPSIAALAAANVFGAHPAPMAFLSYGGYDVTGGSVPLTRAGNIDNLWRVAYPNRLDPKKADSATYFSSDTQARIQQAHRDRIARQQQVESMPVQRRAFASLLAARTGDAGLADLSAYLPDKPVSATDFDDLKAVPAGQRGRLGDIEGFMRQAQLALAAFQSGAGIAASLVMGGYDTHSDHDANHVPQLVRLLRGVDYLLSKAQQLGIDNLYVVVGSDFGRTPYYNQGNGKDHWAVTSMLAYGPGIPGGRVVGGSDEGFRPLSFDPATLKQSSTGVRIKPENVHHALRTAAKLDDGPAAKLYPLSGNALPIFA